VANIRVGRRSGRVVRGGKSRRDTQWIGGSEFAVNIAAAAAPVFISSFNAASLAMRPFTVIRIRGRLGLRSDQSAASEDQLVAHGHAVVSDQAVAIGVTALPTPVTDSNSDLWFQYDWLLADIKVATAISIASIGSYIEVDSRAMRKVEEGQDVVEVAERGAGGAGTTLFGFTRMLLKLH